MKYFVLFSLFLPLTVLAQDLKVHFQKDNDRNEPAYFVNNIFTQKSVMSTLKPNLIDSLYVDKRDTTINGKKYAGKIFIKLKESASFDKSNLLSLENIDKKYIKTATAKIYLVDGVVITENPATYLVDINNIANITVTKLNSDATNLKDAELVYVNTHEYHKKQPIRIRGNNALTAR